MSAADDARIAWTRLLIGTEPKPAGAGRRARGKYIGALDQAWVKQRFGQGGKPLTGTALYHWRKKGIPLEHVPAMIEALQSLLPPEAQKSAPAEAGAIERFVERWESEKPPRWAVSLTERIVEAVREVRQESLEEGARRVLDEQAERLERRILEAQTPGGADRLRKALAARGGRRRSASE